ncbi:MAG: hypothetical protein IKL65_03530 [Bacilli bacterium]|nr:hypothetical protein [Bacilli bacterium]
MEINRNEIDLLELIKKLEPSEIDKLNIFLSKLNTIDDDSKLEILKNIISYSLVKINNMQKSDEEIICEIDGHSFTEWESTYLKKYPNEKEEVIYWRRKCTRCKLVDVSSIDPTVQTHNKSK